MKALALPLLLLIACGERRGIPDTTPRDPRITTLEGLPGQACGSALMVVVTRQDGSQFCIDRFEASTDGGTLGDAHQGTGDTATTTDGSTAAVATVALGVTPITGVSWYQAKSACENAQKRLCTVAEWERACRGAAGSVYPYGDTMDEHACNGFFHFPERKPELTGSLDTCGSAYGVYNLSGNVEEWLENPVERVPGSGVQNDRAVRGGSFKSNSHALTCVGPEFHEAPGTNDIDRGFRCCSAVP